jgi:hypothetical protein
MRIIVYILFLCAAAAIGFAHKSQTIADLTKDECSALFDKGSGYGHDGMYQKQYDTLKKFVELCANVKIGNGKGEGGFNGLDGANGYRNNDKNRHVEYREWIKSVLYLNLDTIYYCRAVSSIVTTLNYNPPVGIDYKAMEAVMRYVVDSGKCKLRFTDIQEILDEIHYYHHKLWRDTVQDSMVTPFDTTGLPTIDELGLSILRGSQNSVSPVAGETQRRLNFVTAERNPFTDEVALKVELNSSTMLRLDIFDELGKSVYGEGIGYRPKGEYRFVVDGKNWHDGAYFARISTSGGEVQTVKLIKQ